MLHFPSEYAYNANGKYSWYRGYLTFQWACLYFIKMIFYFFIYIPVSLEFDKFIEVNLFAHWIRMQDKHVVREYCCCKAHIL